MVRDHCEDWVRVIVTDPARPDQLNQRVRDSYPHALAILHEPPPLGTSPPICPRLSRRATQFNSVRHLLLT